MSEVTAKLSKKDEANRELILRGNMWKVIMKLCIPLALYQSLNQIFKILDTKMAAHISSESVSAVAYLSQINLMLSAIGGGLAVGASLKISEAYGAGDYKLVKQRVSSLYALCGVVSLIVLGGIAPFTEQFLRMANTPESLISVGKQYFIIELFALVVIFFNNVYIAIERARGNSKRILKLNMIVIVLKLGLTALFVYVLDGKIMHIAIATLISQLALLAFALVNSLKRDSAFGFSISSIHLWGKVSRPMIMSSIPVIVEKMAFSFGKVVINSMSTSYGDLTVGALGVSNNIGGITTCPQNGFQEGGAAIISQNLGAKQYKRALDAFKKVLIINVVIGTIGFALTMLYLDTISGAFAESDLVFKDLISHIYRYEAFGAVTLGVNAAVMSLLYGFGLMQYTFFINFSRVFVFRIPVLWFLQQYTNIGSDSVGIVMMVSNISIGVVSAIIACKVIYQIKKNRLRGFDFRDASSKAENVIL